MKERLHVVYVRYGSDTAYAIKIRDAVKLDTPIEPKMVNPNSTHIRLHVRGFRY